MKIVVIGDIHGHATWKEVLNLEKDLDEVVFIADYVDSTSVHPSNQINNLLDIIQYKSDNMDKVKLLIGNHDYSYWPGVNETCSGYQWAMHTTYDYLFRVHKDKFQIAYCDENNIIYSHAGITKTFRDSLQAEELENESLVFHLNAVFKDHPERFGFNTKDRSGYGNHMAQSCIWVRPQALAANNIDNLQIVGHTHTSKIAHKVSSERLGFYVVDSLPFEYVVVEDGEVIIKQLNPPDKKEVTFDI